MRLVSLALVAAVVAACGGSSPARPAPAATDAPAPERTAPPAAAASRDWTRFGYDAAKTNDAPRGISAGDVAKLRERRVALPGTVDSSPIYLAGVRVAGRTRNVIVMTTTYGRTFALDAVSAKLLWQFQPSSYDSVAGSAQITTATPLSDRRFVYAASPDGQIHKLRIGDGHEVAGWPVSITKDPTHEKIASSLNLAAGELLVVTGGYFGDAPPYQGKLVAIDAGSGRITSVFNSLCADRREIIQPSTCPASDSAIWGRAGAVVNPADGHVYVTTSNGPFDGRTNWGDSVLELSAGAGRLLRHYTPSNQAELERADIDLGSTSPALLPSGHPRYAIQGGKDGLLRLLALPDSLSAPNARTGGERQLVDAPGKTDVFSAIAVSGGFAYTTTGLGTAAFYLSHGRLGRVWGNATPGTSPVLAGGVLWVYDLTGALDAYRPADGRVIRRFPVPAGHWNSPIVAGGRVYLPTGNANDHATSGSLSIFER
jgi:outer membrane protein assembly factor BamB